MSDVAMSTVNKRKRDNAGRGAGKAARNGLLGRVFDPKYLPVGSTILTLLIMLAIGQVRYSGSRPFVSMKLFSNLFADNSFILVLAVGMTVCILTGGIDLSVGAVVALVGLVIAKLLPAGVPLPIVLVAAVLIGTCSGLLIGVLVRYFDFQPFIASLAVMFLVRGVANLVSAQSLAINDEGFSALASWAIKFGEGRDSWKITLPMIIAFVVVLIGFYLLHYTRFGRTVYGIGSGDDGAAANLMGLAVGRTKILLYMFSGTCAGIAGILFAMYTKSGYNLTGVGMELDAIAPVAIGGTLLTGGRGYVWGSVVGVMVYGLLQVLIAREGLDSWWTKVFIGVFLLAFVLLQRALSRRGN
ncbi:ABC transporter permease subunit [Actinomyces succiniciruminis]|uniref:Inner membrane ABC transporter permease protein YjfF n=1 Tax=Actinomyces succiniciruminis TaxID=1522002 RepID=A0A1L7RRY5_9ACTO|nr:ABC transporter permease [Actinomyces succiniciruminis]CED92154.1 Inner membrane ABC transporter permease protein YjfF [Actinomyces succiniciruminis]